MSDEWWEERLAGPEPLTWWDRLCKAVTGRYPAGVVRRRLAEHDLAILRNRVGRQR